MARQWATFQEQVAIHGLNVGTAAAHLAVLSQVFNPVFLAGAAIYTIGEKLNDYRRIYSPNSSLYKNKLPKDHRFYRIARALNGKMGLEETEIYYISDQQYLKMSAPFGLRWLVKNQSPRELQRGRENFFAVLPNNKILVTKDSFAKVDDDGVEFTLAHEFSHLKAKDPQTAAILPGIIKTFNRALFFGTLVAAAATAGLGALGIDVMGTMTHGLRALGSPGVASITTGASQVEAAGLFVGFLTSRKAIQAGFGAAKRMIEYRADRNALITTKDMNGALKVMDGFEKNEREGLFGDFFDTHPSHAKRFANLNNVWESEVEPNLSMSDLMARQSGENIAQETKRAGCAPKPDQNPIAAPMGIAKTAMDKAADKAPATPIAAPVRGAAVTTSSSDVLAHGRYRL